MAMTANQLCKTWHPPRPSKFKRASAGTIAAGVRIYNGANCIAVDGVARPLVSGNTLKGLGLLVAGADANGGLYVRAKRPGVRFSTANGTFGIAIAYGSSTVDVALTYANNTTANAAIQLLIPHAEVMRLLAFGVQGTGASNIAAQAAAAVPFIEELGIAQMEANNSGGGSAAALPPDMLFALGAVGMLPASGAAPSVGGSGWLVDDETVTKAASSFDLRGDVVHKTSDGAFYYVDLESVQ